MQVEDKAARIAEPEQSHRHNLDSDSLLSSEAAGGCFSRKSALRLRELMTQLLATKTAESKKDLYEKAEFEMLAMTDSKKEHRNWYRILSGFCLVNSLSGIFDLCQQKMKKASLGPYRESVLRTDSKIREMLSLSLQAAVISGDVFLVKQLLTFARSNTFLLHLNHYWMQVALRVSEPDGPAADDFALLKALLKHETVYKGLGNQSADQPEGGKRGTFNPYQRDIRRQESVLNVLK